MSIKKRNRRAKARHLGNYQSARVDMEAHVGPTDDPAVILERLKSRVADEGVKLGAVRA